MTSASPNPKGTLGNQLVNNLPVMQKTLVRFPSWEGPLEKEMATHSSTLAWRINPLEGGAWRAAALRVRRVRHDLATKPPKDTLQL